jgi:putative acetyltransferase
MLPEVLPLRHASRELVRELGFLQGTDASTSLSHSHCHALIEIDGRGTVTQSELPPLLRLDKSTTSRIVAELTSRGWVKARKGAEDGRVRVLSLTAAGRAKVKLVHREANARVERALATLGESERTTVLRGMELYARALERSRLKARYELRPIKAADRAAVARIIRTVMPEFGAKGPGYAINDPEVDDMFSAYRAKRSAYFVVARDDGEVGGGGGYAPLAGGDGVTCELRKMYFMPEVRGLGLGQELLTRCIEGARRAGFQRMYLETLGKMTAARALYERNGFRRLERPSGATGHFSCDVFYVIELGSVAHRLWAAKPQK